MTEIMVLHARITGSGPTLIILHGLYGSSDNWMSVARELASSFTVCSLDLRNHGKSSHVKEHTYRSMADDVLGWMEKEGIQHSAVLGHSMGGKVAIWLTAMHPEKVTSLILVDIAPVPYASAQKLSPHVLENLNIMTSLMSLDLMHLKSRKEADAELSKTLPDGRLRQFLLKNLQRSAQGHFVWGLNLPALRNALPEILGGMDDLKLGTSGIIGNVPALCIRGSLSDYVGPEEQGFLEQVIPGIRVVTIADAGHWVHAEQPGTFLNAVQDFLTPSISMQP